MEEFSEDLRPAGDNAATGLLLPGQAAGPAGQLLPGQAGGPGSGILSHDAKVTEGSTSEITSGMFLVILKSLFIITVPVCLCVKRARVFVRV